MNLLLIEMDGPDCIADHRLRLQEAKLSGSSPRRPDYYQQLYQPDLMELDEPVLGAREFIEFLTQHAWHVVLLRSCVKRRPQFHATKNWLRTHDFDKYYFEWILREHWHCQLSPLEWKCRKVIWYGTEGGEQCVYRRVVYIDPVQAIRNRIQTRWSSVTDRTLETYSGLTEFSPHLALGSARPGIEMLLNQHPASDDPTAQELVVASEAQDEWAEQEPMPSRETTLIEIPQVELPPNIPSEEIQKDLPPENRQEAAPATDEMVQEAKEDLEPETRDMQEVIEEISVREDREREIQGRGDSTEALFTEEDADNQEEPREEITRPRTRKPRTVTSVVPDDFLEEEEQPPRKKQKGDKRERATRRNLKAAAEVL